MALAPEGVTPTIDPPQNLPPRPWLDDPEDRGPCPEPMTEVIREAVCGVIREMFLALEGTIPLVSGSPPSTGEC